MSGGRYSKIYRSIWTDEKFRKLSPARPNGQTLFLRLLSGPELGPIPGLFAAREPGLADAQKWSLKQFRKAFRELSEKGMAKADWDAGLVWVPNAIKYNEPANPNVVLSWADEWAELPECPLKSEAHRWICVHLNGRGQAFLSAFTNHCRDHSANGSENGSPNHCPNQEQEQEQKLELEGRAGDVPGSDGGDTPKKIRPRTAHDLIHCLRVAVQREQPQNGLWSPGNSFAHKEADCFVQNLGDIEAALPEIEARIEAFAKDPNAAPWTVAKFVNAYNGIGSGRGRRAGVDMSWRDKCGLPTT